VRCCKAWKASRRLRDVEALLRHFEIVAMAGDAIAVAGARNFRFYVGAGSQSARQSDLVEEGLRLVLEIRRESRRHRLADLMKCARGTVNSGLTDLASNPEHLKTFGRKASRRGRIRASHIAVCGISITI
jgi:hypothetical protein